MVDNQYPPVFVTYGWCRTAYAVVLSLGRRGIDVHVSDASSSAMSRSSRYCRSYVKVPDFFVEPERYFDAICEALKKTGAGVLLPAHEDVGIFCQRRNELPPGVRVALPELGNLQDGRRQIGGSRCSPPNWLSRSFHHRGALMERNRGNCLVP